MSIQPTHEPACLGGASTQDIETMIEGRARSLGDMRLRRILPSIKRRLVGPFIFFDHIGPDTLPPGRGIDVPPHPHINLATVTYLFAGEMVHKDSLGSNQAIRPGAINWMTAGRGIVHSERTGEEERARGGRVHGIQLWVALPREHEETEPEFHHHPADTLPELERAGVTLRVLAGSAYGVTAPVRTYAPLFDVEASMPAGTELELPSEYAERAAYVVEGVLCCGPEHTEAGRMLVFTEGSKSTLRAEEDARVMVLGGASLEGKRHIYWNFVSSRPERIEEAKRDWKERRFPVVPGDEDDFVPLPE